MFQSHFHPYQNRSHEKAGLFMSNLAFPIPFGGHELRLIQCSAFFFLSFE